MSFQFIPQLLVTLVPPDAPLSPLPPVPSAPRGSPEPSGLVWE